MPAVLGLLVLLAGLGYASGVAGYKWHLHAKAERLHAEGVPVRATVTGRRDTVGRGGGTDTVRVSYEYAGVPYTERILCGSAGGCAEEPPAEMTLWVDPERPAEFVAENGNTDDSVFVLNAWGGLPFGLVVAAFGGLLLVTAVLPDRAPAPRRDTRRPGRDRIRRSGSARRRRGRTARR
ncbi:DUF3592 domain-containing protein [Micromonospora sp. C28SCA-DRY-2]|uniref:DUF3592 domain-containing protein n=1 Tax=Micromonospora sp. C28SCA-DRY-2 TaxID=3059522 RepID=UPI002676BF78|nr:DUF3592 domain-containing protein [Micromonospora sp. C28SCA-DRY-2]MDO3702314.1 DUF3592 domain-containing protein [Micromonospora sp. C28SCA-DRY-2]